MPSATLNFNSFKRTSESNLAETAKRFTKWMEKVKKSGKIKNVVYCFYFFDESLKKCLGKAAAGLLSPSLLWKDKKE